MTAKRERMTRAMGREATMGYMPGTVYAGSLAPRTGTVDVYGTADTVAASVHSKIRDYLGDRPYVIDSMDARPCREHATIGGGYAYWVTTVHWSEVAS